MQNGDRFRKFREGTSFQDSLLDNNGEYGQANDSNKSLSNPFSLPKGIGKNGVVFETKRPDDPLNYQNRFYDKISQLLNPNSSKYKYYTGMQGVIYRRNKALDDEEIKVDREI
jgi:hypothetical protein